MRIERRLLSVADAEVSGPTDIYYAGPTRPAEVRIREPLLAHLQDVSAVESHVVEVMPAAWRAVRSRWTQLVGSAFPCRTKLADAIVRGDGDIEHLAALALSEVAATSEVEQEVRRHVGAAVLAELTRQYQPVAVPVYRRISALFDAASQQGDDYQLDELLIALIAAARLCGATPDVAPAATNKLALTLSVDPKRAHQRRLVEAFAQPNRWSRIRELGATIRANADPKAEAWQLPALTSHFDKAHILRKWDPLDGPVPRGWSNPVEGWLGE